MGEKENNNNLNESPVTRWLRNAVLGATMADLPAMMTASGWRLNEKGDYVLDQQNDPHVKLLRDTLAAEGAGVMLGEFGLPAIYGLYNLGVRGLAKSGNNWARANVINKEMNNIIDEGLQYFGKVKYYGPTMGKTTAAKTNPDLADFDDVTREAKNNLAKELNIPTRVLQSDPKYALAYLEMLERELNKWRRNPLNTDKTLVISKKGLADKNVYNNEPSIPDRQTFVQRLRNRGETDDANSNDWYNMLMKQNPNLRIDNRFVSEIEYNPHYIGFQPATQQSSKTSLKFYERPLSKLTESERTGLPKGLRNLPMNKVESKHSASNSLYEGSAKDNRTFTPPSEKKNYFQLFGDDLQIQDFNGKLVDYIKGLPDADDMFLNSNGILSAYVHDFRKYLDNIGYDVSDIPDLDLAKLISQQYRDLNATMAGKAKGMVMWHGSPTMFDNFDFSHTGSYTGNMGMGGPGNYFSNSRANYGIQRDGSVLNMLPYLINDIQSTPTMSIMKEKGLLPKYVSPGSKREFSAAEGPYLEYIKKLLKETPTNDSKLYIDDFSTLRPGTLDPVNGLLSEYMLRRNDGIKSLFPHPSTFVRNADGSVSIRRDWADPRVNYKSGGKLIKRKK